MMILKKEYFHMTNRNHKFSKGQTKENNGTNKINEKRGKGMGGIISMYVSVLGAVVSIVSVIFTIFNVSNIFEEKII